MKPKFSEFQFAHGLTRELEGPRPRMGLIDVPVFPTQNEEAHIPADTAAMIEDGDVRMAPLFLQYKRAEKMTRSYAREWKYLDSVVGVDEEYFRFDIYLGKHDQHNKLVRMAKEVPLTFYVAPAFTEHQEYRRYASKEIIYENSAFIQCSDLSLVVDEDHVVAYTFPDPKGVVCSEPTEVKVQQGGQGVFEERIEDSLRTFQTLRANFNDLRGVITYDIDGYEQDNKDFIDPRDYDSDNLIEWMRGQKRYFRETADADLLFFVEEE